MLAEAFLQNESPYNIKDIMPTKKRRFSATKRRWIQSGGNASPKIVGQGTYGCGFAPALRCNTNSVQPANTFSKFMTSAAANDEEHITVRIKNINAAQKYSVYPTKKCAPKTNNIKSHANEFKRCGMLEQYIVSYPSLVQSWFNPSFENKLIANIDSYKILQSPQGGTSLSAYISSITFTKNPKEVIHLFIGLTNLFEGLLQFHQQHYYHMDIKTPNIVVKTIGTDAPPQIRFIDFGLSIDGNAPISYVAETYRKTYFAWPFELRYFEQLEYAVNKKDVSLLTKQLRDFYKNGIDYPINAHGIPESHYIDTVDGTPKFHGNMIKPLLQRLINAGKDSKFLFATADVYAMGILLGTVIYQLTQLFINNNIVYYDNNGVEKPIQSSTASDTVKRFVAQFAADALQLAADCTQVDPLSRPTAEELYTRYSFAVNNLIKETQYIITGIQQRSTAILQKKTLPPLPASAIAINIPPPPLPPSKKLKPARLPAHIIQQQKNIFKVTKKAK